MSDLEAPDPVEAPPQETAAETPPDPSEQEPEGTTDVGGQKHVPLSHLIEARREKQAFKQKAEQYDSMVAYVNEAKPYIEFLRNNPNLLTRTQEQTQPTPVTTTQPSDEKAEQLARTLDLYTSDGKPDVKRAQTIRQMVKDEATEQADAKVKPLQESTIRERAGFMYQRALATPLPNGQKLDKGKFDAIWSRAPLAQLATEEGAAFILASAVGFDVLSGNLKAGTQTTTQPLPPPLHTESPGNRTPQAQRVSGLEERIAKTRGVSLKQHSELVKGFTAQQTNTLEDE